MPRILIQTDRQDAAVVTLSERITADDLLGEHFCGCLVERIAWAVDDAEHTPAAAADDEIQDTPTQPDLRVLAAIS